MQDKYLSQKADNFTLLKFKYYPLTQYLESCQSLEANQWVEDLSPPLPLKERTNSTESMKTLDRSSLLPDSPTWYAEPSYAAYTLPPAPCFSLLAGQTTVDSRRAKGGGGGRACQPFICHSKNCVLTFLLARNICIYQPLLNEPHSSTIDHSIPLLSKPISCKSVMFQPFLVSNFVQFFMVLLHTPSLIF